MLIGTHNPGATTVNKNIRS